MYSRPLKTQWVVFINSRGKIFQTKLGFSRLRPKSLQKSLEKFPPKKILQSLSFQFLANYGRLEEGGVLGTLHLLPSLLFKLPMYSFFFCIAGKLESSYYFPTMFQFMTFFWIAIHILYIVLMQYLCNMYAIRVQPSP